MSTMTQITDSELQITVVSEEASQIVARAIGELRGSDTKIEEWIRSLSAKGAVLLNLEDVSFINSAGISWLLVSHKAIRERGGVLVLFNVPPIVLQPLEFMRLPTVLNIAVDEAEARAIAQGVANA